jgi:hypothetical protein
MPFESHTQGPQGLARFRQNNKKPPAMSALLIALSLTVFYFLAEAM